MLFLPLENLIFCVLAQLLTDLERILMCHHRKENPASMQRMVLDDVTKLRRKIIPDFLSAVFALDHSAAHFFLA
jgi:hypothetical protein